MAGTLLGLLPVPGRTQSMPLQNATDFSTVDYFDPPNQMQISSRLSGTRAQPLSEDTTLIQQMKLETFATNGASKYIVQAPECVYDRVKGVASSPGHLTVREAAGQMKLEGDGFLWQEDRDLLTISNNVSTTLNSSMGGKGLP